MFLLVPAYPACLGQNPETCKTVMYMCVCVTACVFQACWRGAAVRNSLRKVRRDYAEIFHEIEQKPSCSVEWHLGKHTVIGKPQFIPLDRRNYVRLDAAKSKEPMISDVVLPLVQNCSDEDLQAIHFEADSMRTNLAVLNNDEPTILVPHTDTNTRDVSQSDLPNASVNQQERELDACNVDNCRNFEDISVDQADRDDCDSTTVVSNVELQKDFQASSSEVPGNEC